MKIKERTLKNLRNNLKGKIHVYLKDGKTMRRFFADAEEQGWLFGTSKPTDCTPDNIVALEDYKQLSFLGIAGRICFQTNGGSNPKGTYHRIDYAKYINCVDNYYYRDTNDSDNDCSPDEDNEGKEKPHYAEIWMCWLPKNEGSVQSGYRPVYIASNDLNNNHCTTVNVIPLTSKNKKYLPIHVCLDCKPENGLTHKSILLIEQMTTVSISTLQYKVGRITDGDILQKISNAMSIQFPDVDVLKYR